MLFILLIQKSNLPPAFIEFNNNLNRMSIVIY